MISERLLNLTARMTKEAGLGKTFNLIPIDGGHNNKVFRVNMAGSALLLKLYFHHPGDPRDRLKAEFSFYQFAWENGIRCLPRPILCDFKNKIGLYEFIDGRIISPEDMTQDFVLQALQFYHDLNRFKHQQKALELPIASECSFTIEGYFQKVEKRLSNLALMEETVRIHREAAKWVRQELYPTWIEIYQTAKKQIQDCHLDSSSEIVQEDRCISPSDFGFHNALLAPDGKIRFIDFEYSGWDDPTKLVCDFFCQPAVPVPMQYFESFTHLVAEKLAHPNHFLNRIQLLLPVHKIKWCCIIMDDFLPVDSRRRRFAARHKNDKDELKKCQLQKAQTVLEKIKRSLKLDFNRLVPV